jgi:dephospho-CoA kinase
LSHWPGKYTIGLTGNIATGKSVVRRMLEHLGAYTIDADALSHRAIAKGAPGYQQVLDEFGKWMLNKDGEIDRAKLGRLVFSDPEALAQLEGIVHPLVRQAVDLLARRARQSVIVIEAIKLLEGELRKVCDTVWVTDAPQDVQVARLMRKRAMSREDALQRVRSQSAQSKKVAVASVVIHNTGSYEMLWEQVTTEWKKIAPSPDTVPLVRKALSGNLEIQRGRPRDSKSIAAMMTRAGKGVRQWTSSDVMAAFGDKAFMLLKMGDELAGLAGWQVENLVARITDLYVEEGVNPRDGLQALIREVERASRDLQCEAALVFPNEKLAAQASVWNELGYERRAPDRLGVQAWQDAAAESMPDGSALFFKQLRKDRILRPI